MFLRRIKVAPRIVIGFSCSLILMAIISANGILNFRQIGHEMDVLEKTSNVNYYTMFARMDQAHYEKHTDDASVSAVISHLKEAQNMANQAKLSIKTKATKDMIQRLTDHLDQLVLSFGEYVTLEQQKKEQENVWIASIRSAEEAIKYLVNIEANVVRDQKDTENGVKSFEVYRITSEAYESFIQAQALVNEYLSTHSQESLTSANELITSSSQLFEEQKALFYIEYSNVVIKELSKYQTALNEYAELKTEQELKLQIMNENAQQVSEIAAQTQAKAKENVESMKVRSFLTALLLTFIAIVIGILSTVFINRSIRIPLKHYITNLKEFSEGDMTAQFDVSGKDELTEMGKALSLMKHKLREAISQIIQNAEGFQTASQEVINSTDYYNGNIVNELDRTLKLSAETEESMDNVSLAVEEVSKGALSSAEYATESANAAERTRNISLLASNAMDQVVVEINLVGTNSRGIHAKMNDVSQSVEKISVITGRITEIAEQTNLLALNATIEAARAGEQGKGFAVVAGEVRKLSEESDQLAKEIDGMIQGLIIHTRATSEEVKASEKIVQSVSEKSLKTKEDLHCALDEIQKLSLSMQSIAAVTQEQASSSQEIMATTESVLEATSSVVISVNKISDLNNESVDVTSKELLDIQHKARELVEILSYFKL